MRGRGGDRSTFAVRVSARLGRAEDVDLEVRARRDATVRALADALAEIAGVESGAPLHSMRIGPIAADLELSRAGLRDGDVIALRPLPRDEATHPGSPPPVVELAVVAGPDAGRRLPLSAGRHEIGRDPGPTGVTIDDPSMSKRHLALEVDDRGNAVVEDLDSLNGTAIDGVALAAGESCLVGSADEVEAGRSLISLRSYRSSDPTLVETRAGKVAFNRPPRVSRPFEPVELRAVAPPREPRGVRFPLVAALIPVALGIALWLVTKTPTMLMMALFSPLMLLGSAVSDKRSGRRDHRHEVEAFEAGLEQLEESLEAARAEEIAHRRASAPDAAELGARARRRLADLWERRPDDADFLDVRIGIADQPTTTAVAIPDGGQEDLRRRLETLVERYATVPSMPVRIALGEVGAVGLSGDRDGIDRLARWLVAQAAVLHSPRDLVVAAILGEDRERDWRWLGWLPHAASETSLLPVPNIAVGTTEGRELLRSIAVIAAERRAENEGRTRGRRRLSMLLLVDDGVELEPAVIDDLLDGCAEVDVAAIWMAPEARQLPGGCQALVELAAGRAIADVTWTTSGRRIEAMSAEGITEEIAEAIARSLAAVVDVGARGAATDLPREAPLLELLDVVEPTPEQIVARWDKRQPGDPLAAVLGVGADGDFEVDLRSQGPHSLIAGTTGAGKSELLLSLVGSLAATHPPDRLAFLLVDYKGGAAFRECERLPHTVGMVTDLDEHLVHRVLLSLNSELKRRERLLADAEASDLLKLERRDPVAAPPSLAIVIDEFATLAKEVPEFVEGVVDVAQRGRSLGLHLILATQRPGSVVTDNIRANTNLRISLRVSEPDHSVDVIGAPDAARLRPSQMGRAFARVGPSELVPFQVGYVGGLTRAEAEAAELELRELRFGAPIDLPSAAGTGADSVEGDLAMLVDAVTAATESLGIQPPPRPWIPELPDAVGIADLHQADEVDGDRAAIALIDEPRRQRRSVLALDLAADGNLLVFGASGSGKTTLLRTIAVALAERSSPAELNLYGLDFAGRGLDRLAALPHCGSVIPGEDAERVQRLLGFLRRTIDERALRLSEARVSSLEDHRQARPEEAMARIVVLLDSYAGFTDLYERVDLGAMVDALPRLVADGRAVGVHFVIAADRRQAVPTAISSVVTRRIVLRMASDEEYMAIGLDAREIKGAKLPPGRGFLEDGREVQVAVVGGSEDPARQLAEIEIAGRRLEELHGDLRATPIERFPSDLDRAELPSPTEPLAALLGVEETELAPVEVSLRDMHLIVAGPYRSGRSTALATLTASLLEATPGLRAHLLAPRRSPLPELDFWASTSRGIEQCEESIAELLNQFLADDEDGPVLVVLDDGGELAESRAAGELEQLIKRGRDRDLRFLVAFETAEARHYATWIRELRKDGHGLLLDPDLDLDGDLLGVRLPRRTHAVHPPGRGYLVAAGVSQQVQVAR